jgi:HEAT repeat protein
VNLSNDTVPQQLPPHAAVKRLFRCSVVLSRRYSFFLGSSVSSFRKSGRERKPPSSRSVFSCAALPRKDLDRDALSRGRLYERMLDLLLGDHKRADEWRPMLRELACAMMAAAPERPALAYGDVLERLRHSDSRPRPEQPADRRLGAMEKAEALCEELERKRVVTAVDDVRVFPGALAAYLTADDLARRINKHGWHTAAADDGLAVAPAEFVMEKAGQPAWRDVLLFLAGRLNDPRPLLQSLIEAADDPACLRLALALECLAEVVPELRRNLVDLANRIVRRAFLTWWKHAAAGAEAAVAPLGRALWVIPWLDFPVRDLSLPVWIAARLAAGDDRVLKMVQALGSATPRPALRDRLEQMLEEPSEEVRGRALEAVGAIGPGAARGRLLELLGAQMADVNEAVRRSAAVAAAGLGIAAATAEILHGLLRLVDDVDCTVRLAAVRAYVRVACPPVPWDEEAAVGPPDRGAESLQVRLWLALAGRLRDADSGVREAAIGAIRQLGRRAAVPVLLGELATLLEHDDKEIRLAAAWACLSIGRKAARPEIVTRLARVLKEEGVDALRDAVQYLPEAAALRRKLAALATPDLMAR